MSRCRLGSMLKVTAIIGLLVPWSVEARTLSVSPGNYDTLADALNAAQAGDMVLVGCGNYPEQNLVVKDGVILRGASGNPGCVWIESFGGTGSALFVGNAGPQTRIENITVTVWPTADPDPVLRGAGVFLTAASPSFSNCVFRDLAADYGGAVYGEENSAPVFFDCRFLDNTARAAGGAVNLTSGSTARFVGCLFATNSAAVGGTINIGLGASLTGPPTPTTTLNSCTIVYGESSLGAGLASWDASGIVLQNTIVAEGVTGRAWDGDHGSVPFISCSDLYNNAGGDWVGALAEMAGVSGNLSADPQFCGVSDFANPFTLNSGSPCAEAANPGCGEIGAYTVNCNFVADVDGPHPERPSVSGLRGSYPNPFNPRTTVLFDLSHPGAVDLAVYDLAGRLVRHLVRTSLPAGRHEAVWEGRDTAGRQVAAGIYFLHLKTGGTVDTRRVTLVK